MLVTAFGLFLYFHLHLCSYTENLTSHLFVDEIANVSMANIYAGLSHRFLLGTVRFINSVGVTPLLIH